MQVTLQIAGFILLCLLLLFFWMRSRMKASKGYFALVITSTLLTCFLTGIAAVSTSLPTAIASKFSESLGFGPIESGAPSFIGLLLTLGAMLLIYKFGVTAVQNWDAPPRVSEIDLAENHLENSIPALTLEKLKYLIKNQDDPLASDAVANWKNKVSEPPPPVPIKDLLKDMLVSAISEIHIPEDGWRDEGQFWVGEVLGLRPEDTRPIIVFVDNDQPSKLEITHKLENLNNRFGNIDDFTFYSTYMFRNADINESSQIEVSGKSISLFSSRDLIRKGIDLHRYAREIIYAFERTHVGGTSAFLKDTYVELNVEINEFDKSPEKISDKLSEWARLSTSEHIALTGEYGQGKSTVLLKYCYDWAKKFVESGAIGERVPLLIELRGQNPSETDPLGFLATWCARYELPPKKVLNLIKAGDAIVIFEGFDELRNAGRAFYRHQHFNALWEFAYPGTKLIFTGRPNFFIDEEEANRTLRHQEDKKIAGDVFTSVWKLKKLNQEQIINACRAYEDGVKNGIDDAIKSTPEFLDIVSRPSMLPVVATIWSDIDDLQRAGIPLTGAILIEKYIQAVFSRKEAELERDRVKYRSPSGSRYLVLPKQVRELLTVCVAWRMSGLEAKNTISRTEIIEMVRDLYDELIATSKSIGVSPSIADGLIEFERRFADESKADRVEAIVTEICSAGLLVSDAAGGASHLRFPHKQFFEYLIAKGVAIKTTPERLNASKILEKASNETSVLLRLESEPNSTLYLTDCIGTNLKRFLPFLERLLLRLDLVPQLITLRFTEFLSKKTHNTFTLGSAPSVAEQDNIDNPLNTMRPILYATFVLAIVTSLVLAVFLKDEPSSSGTSIISPINILVSLLTLIFSIVSFFNYAYKAKSRSSQIYNFFHIHWQKEAASPETYLDELSLIYLSLTKGSVQFGKPYNDESDYSRFSYPAEEFGKATDLS